MTAPGVPADGPERAAPRHILSRCGCLSCADERLRLNLNPLVSDLERIARRMVIRELVRGA